MIQRIGPAGNAMVKAMLRRRIAAVDASYPAGNPHELDRLLRAVW